ncbi:MAG: tRNA (guanine-N(7)-)-methyltransferase [Candidatus Celerinatantimonas neptuna]|nr:MAG: tRNA (guanine-N(7)-)-methyltransferase [Candidatus Celerinatantimonas neptuna]
MDYEVKQTGNSRWVVSTQPDIHPNLVKVVERHRLSDCRRPIAAHSQAAFDELLEWIATFPDETPLILDSCCGVGQSTAHIAAMYPDAAVIGVDKSAVRLKRHHAYQVQQENYQLFRADLHDLWRLMVKQQLRLWRHFLLYPTPWPKPMHLQRRWYASNCFPALVELGGEFVLRSNWPLYLRECGVAFACYQIGSEMVQLESVQPMTPFEQKYQASGQSLWQLTANLNV